MYLADCLSPCPSSRGADGSWRRLLFCWWGLLYYLTYQPYSAAKSFIAAFGSQGTTTVAERLTLAERSFDTFPPMANFPRAIFSINSPTSGTT